MESRSVNREIIDWVTFRQRVKAKAKKAQKIKDTYPALQLALTLLGDNHSKYITPEGTEIVGNHTIRCSAEDPPFIPGILGIGYVGIGYIRIPSFKGNESSGVDFANSIQARIKKIDDGSIKGWIVDLRSNTGGDFWPMLAGIGPILGNGVVGYFVDPKGKFYSWSYQNGITRQGQKVLIEIINPYHLRKPNPKVAVLTNIGTASSGEGIAICFKKRPNTRSFGTITCGLSTSNSVIHLSDGASLVLTQVTMADRNKTIYSKSITPDETLPSPMEVVRSISWLLNP